MPGTSAIIQMVDFNVKVMEAAKAHYEGGRADLVIAELAPLLLSEAGAAGKGPLSKPKTILEGLQVLQVGLSHLPSLRSSSATLKVCIQRLQCCLISISSLSAAFFALQWQLMINIYLVKAVCYAQDAAVALKDASCELKCRLVALKWLLPPIPKNVCDDSALHSAPASGPPPAAMGDLQKAFRSIAVEVGPCWAHRLL